MRLKIYYKFKTPASLQKFDRLLNLIFLLHLLLSDLSLAFHNFPTISPLDLFVSLERRLMMSHAKDNQPESTHSVSFNLHSRTLERIVAVKEISEILNLQ